MIIEMVSLFFLLDPNVTPMGGIYCDEVAREIIEYNRETGAFSQEQLEGMIGRCEVWEDGYEEGVESGEVEPLNN